MLRRRLSAALPVQRSTLLQLVLDGGLVALAYPLAYRLRFDGTGALPDRYEQLYHRTWPAVVIGTLLILIASGAYRRWMRYATQRDYVTIVRAVLLATLALVGYVALVSPVQAFVPEQGFVGVTLPTGVAVLFGLLALTFLVGARFAVHSLYERPVRGLRAVRGASEVLIVGAGDGGRLLLREIVRNPDLRYRPVGFVDDDPVKQGMRIERGVRVLGPTAELGRILDEVGPEEVLIAVPSAPGTMRARVVSACRGRGIPVRTMPTVFELLRGGANVVRQVRDVRVEDVLGREPVRMDASVGEYLNGRVVLVTGAGGSIGSELCRQIARVGPARLVLLDHAEDNLFEVLRDLREDRHVAGAVGVLADCKDTERLRGIFAAHRPAFVFHAAAYKHVGMMEDNPIEAVRNNSIATRVLAHLAGEHHVERFVLVSTDKAVSPATVMGASKALAEWAVDEAAARHQATRYASVRFGNVLGSSGSVVPIFRRQIAQGGPVTVTDPQMTRYFMTIPEAVQLIVQAGALASGGEVFVLEMGHPVPIVDLARDMIRLSGLEPDSDIAIEVVGRRPGEKLHEDLFNPYERSAATAAPRIMRADRESLDAGWLADTLDHVDLLTLEDDAAGLAAKVSELSALRVVARDPGQAALDADRDDRGRAPDSERPLGRP